MLVLGLLVLLRLVVRLVGRLLVDVLRDGHAETRRRVGGRGELIGRRRQRDLYALVLVLTLGVAVHAVVDLLLE